MNNSFLNFIMYFIISIIFTSCSLNKATEVDNVGIEKTNEEPETQLESPSYSVLSSDQKDILSLERLDNVNNTSTSNVQEIALLKSKVKYLENELKNKGDANSIFSNPYALFNQQIVMENGTIYYGSVIYQDDSYVTIETLIGKLNIERSRIKRVLSHHLENQEVPIFPEIDFEANTSIEDGDILYKSPANVILNNNINTTIDENGNTVLSGQLKNIGGKRADFVKINMTLYRDWSQTLEPKTFTIFAKGTLHYFDDDTTKVSNSSIEPKALADFSLIIPKSFGNVMSWKYNVDFEAY